MSMSSAELMGVSTGGSFLLLRRRFLVLVVVIPTASFLPLLIVQGVPNTFLLGTSGFDCCSDVLSTKPATECSGSTYSITSVLIFISSGSSGVGDLMASTFPL
jgi:hypothetical protein